MASTPKLSAAAEITACPLQMAGSRSALKSSNGTTPNKTRKHASSHVQLDPCPTMVIESEEVLCSPAEGCSLQRLTSTALVQSLAQAGSPGELSVDLHSMMAQLAATLLAQKPKDPEQYVVDHLLGKKLPRSQAGSTTAGVEGTPRVESSTLSISSNDDLVFNKDRREPSLSFAGPGNTVVQRLVCTELNKPSRSVLVKAAKELLSKKPDDPEHYLWTRMESRSFWDESAAANAWAQTADGEPLPPPKGLTQASLLKEVPPATPGFNTAANMVHLLFSNKPDDPIQFLVSHYGARVLNSGGSMRGNSTSRRPGDGDEASSMTATSRDLLDDNDDEDSNNEEGSGPARGPSLQRKGSLGSFGTFHGGARRNSSRSGSRRHAAVSTSGAVPTSTCTSEPGGSLRQARHVNVFDPSSVEPVESLLSISQLEQLPRRERDAAVKEWELLRSREDLHRHRLQYEVQSLWLDRQFRDRMSCIDPSEATTLAAQTAAHAHAEAAQYLRQRQTRLDQLTALIEQAHGCDESNE